MELKITKNKYSTTKSELVVDEELSRVEAYSYEWWKFVATDSVGNIIFNNYNYSKTTSTHQSDAWSILRRLGIRITLELQYTDTPLNNLSLAYAFDDEIRHIENKCNNLLRKITGKGTHKSANERRVKQIDCLVNRIIKLEYFKKMHLNKKKYEFAILDDSPKIYKKNGKLNYFDTKIVASRTQDDLNAIPNATKTVCKRWNISFNSLDLQIYPHTENVIEMLAANDPRDKKLRTKIKKLASAKNTLALDKIHTYFINKSKRETLVKRDPNEIIYNVNPILFNIENVTPIVNRYQLKKEGNRQSHCIGTCTKYHTNILTKNYQAFNYKSYTFYTDFNLNIIETYGKNDIPTPKHVISDLNKALSNIKEL